MKNTLCLAIPSFATNAHFKPFLNPGAGLNLSGRKSAGSNDEEVVPLMLISNGISLQFDIRYPYKNKHLIH